MISVLIPTRGRPEGLLKAMISLSGFADDCNSIEFIVRADVDDALLPSIKNVAKGCGAVFLVGARGAGYRDVFKMYNAMAEISHGDWIINWNDDVAMLTQGWDTKVREAAPHSVQFFRRDILEHADTTFPCTGRSVYQAMGHLSLQIHADEWMGKVADAAGVSVYRDEIVFHHDRLNDQTSFDRDHGGYDTDGFNTPEMRQLREEAAARVRAAKELR